MCQFGAPSEPETLANSGFAVISLLSAAAIVYGSTHQHTASDRWLCAALGLILAGTLGNFYDRVVFNGVRDFLHWNYLFDWPVFNVADRSWCAVRSCLLLQAFATQPEKEETKADSTVVSPSAHLPRPGELSAAGTNAER